MLKKIIPFLAAVFCSVCLFADTPGKATMHESKINFQGIKNVPGYTFYWSGQKLADTDTITTESSFSLKASQGAPFSYWFWAVNNSTKKSTDTVSFSNYYAPDYVIILNAIKNDSIYFTQKELSNSNKIVSEGNTDSIANKQLVADAKSAKRGHYTTIILFSIAGAVALGGLIWFFVRRKRKKDAVV